MRPQIDPARRCLPISDWPNIDRAAWNAALCSNDPLSLEPSSTAASWKPPTRHKNRRGYGRWLTFLKNSGLDLSGAADERVTRERVAAYIAELRLQGVAPYTLRNRILELHTVMMALAPHVSWSWLRACVVHFDRRAQDVADRSLPPLLASDLLIRGMKELRQRSRVAIELWRDAIAYRNWLMVVILAVLPLRLRNFASLSLRQMERRAGTWWVNIDGSETKTGRPHAALIPPDAAAFVDHYLSRVRPHLDRGRAGDCLWLSAWGAPLAEHTIYLSVTELTKRAFGISINPHLFRRIFATSVSIADPEAIEGARAALGHATRRTTQHHYNRASTFTATRKHAEIMKRLRAQHLSSKKAVERSGMPASFEK
jgi:integrase